MKEWRKELSDLVGDDVNAIYFKLVKFIADLLDEQKKELTKEEK